MHCIVLRNALYKTNNFSVAKAKTMLLLVKPISKGKNLYINAFNNKDPVFDRRDPADID